MTYQRSKTQYKGPREAAILRSTKEGWVNVSMPYDPKCIEDIKSWIETSGRRWNPDTKFWEVKEIYLDQLITILRKHFGDNVSTNLLEHHNDNPFSSVLDLISEKDIDKIYRALAFAVHPDRGGSNELMAKLNDAFNSRKTLTKHENL